MKHIYKIIRIIAYIITALFIIGATWYGYENLNQVRKSTNDYDKSINEVITQYADNYQKDVESLEQTEKNLADSEARLKKLFEKAGLEW